MDSAARSHRALEETQRIWGMAGSRRCVVGLEAYRVRDCTWERRMAFLEGGELLPPLRVL